MKKTKKLLKEFSSIAGLTGMEKAVAEKFIEYAKEFSDEVYIDKMGNGIAVKKGKGKRRILAAGHIDEVGMIVTKIEKGGALKLYQVGGVDPMILLGQEIVVHTESGDIEGVIGSKPPHFQTAEDRKKNVSWENIFADIGLDEDEVKKKVQIGSFVSFKKNAFDMKGDRVCGKSIDDRYGVVALLLTLQRLEKMKPEWDFYAVGSVQEEWSGIGANASGYEIKPDIAIAIDVTHGNLPGLEEENTFELGKGITLSIGPNIHPGILRKAKKVCKDEEIPFKIEIAPYGTGTDAYTFQTIGSGIPSLAISAPLRSMHSPVEVISIKDVERTARLLANFICEIEDKDLDVDFEEEENGNKKNN